MYGATYGMHTWKKPCCRSDVASNLHYLNTTSHTHMDYTLSCLLQSVEDPVGTIQIKLRPRDRNGSIRRVCLSCCIKYVNPTYQNQRLFGVDITPRKSLFFLRMDMSFMGKLTWPVVNEEFCSGSIHGLFYSSSYACGAVWNLKNYYFQHEKVHSNLRCAWKKNPPLASMIIVCVVVEAEK